MLQCTDMQQHLVLGFKKEGLRGRCAQSRAFIDVNLTAALFAMANHAYLLVESQR